MKKFSNLEEKKVLVEKKPQINRLVEHLIKENLQVVYNGDVDEAIKVKLSIDGSNELTEKLNQIIEEHIKTTEIVLKEQLKYKYGNQFDQNEINNLINENYSNLYLNINPFPQDIFSPEDYELNEDVVVLRTLNNIPSDYMDYVNYTESEKYFESGNKVKMRYDEGCWEISFEDNKSYGTTIDSKTDKYKKFISENKDFVADFIKATSELIGTQNLLLDTILVSQI